MIEIFFYNFGLRFMLFISFLQEGNNFTKKLNKIIISEKVEIYEPFLIID